MSRLAAGLRALVAGPRSPLQRARNFLLRPARHELADLRRETEALRIEIAATNARERALAEDNAHLHAAIATTEAREHDTLQAQLQALRAELQARRRHGALLERLLVSTQPPAAPRVARVAGRPARISIVLPTRNRAAFVTEAIQSVQAQSFQDWELIVVDDGSSDDTLAVVSGFLGDERIRLENIEHAGSGAARNHALALARGELFAYIDSDNLWFPGFLAAAVAALDAEPGLDLLYGALVTEAHGLADGCLLLQEFDRPRLLHGNYIDMSTVVHRRALYDELGGFERSINRLEDWDLVLRYTAGHAARALPVLAVRYRVCDAIRMTDNVPIGPNWLSVRRRADPVTVPSRPPRILYVVWHYPQLSETYVEGEIRCMRRWGVEIEVWRQVPPVSGYESQVPVHDGELAEAVRRFGPDAIHVHWMRFALSQGNALGALGLPVSLRMHGFDVTPGEFARLLEQPWLHRVYAFPAQLQLLPAADARVVPMASAFDSSLFRPAADKDRRLVLRAGACLPSKDIGLFFELAKRLPDFRFVFAGVTCNEFEHFPEQLRRLAAELESPVELRFDLPREQMAELFATAGIYLHTINPPDAAFGAPIGMPISIAEALASGAYVLVRDLPELAAYVGTAGATYADLDEAQRLVAQTAGWGEAQWRAVRIRASDRGYLQHADELVLRPLYEDWCRLAAVAGATA